MALYDKSGKNLVFQNYHEAENAVRDGQAYFKKGEKVTLVDEDYNIISVRGSQVGKYLKLGYTLNPLAVSAGENAQRPENQGIIAGLREFGKGFVNEALMGVPEAIVESTLSEQEKANRDAIEAQNKISSSLGKIGGVATSLLYGGEITQATRLGRTVGLGAEKVATKMLGDVASQGAAKKALARAIEGSARLGVESAAWTAPRAITEAALGDPESAGEHLAAAGLAGGALGLVFAPIVPSITKYVGEKAQTLRAGQIIDKNKEAARILGVSPKQYDMVSQTVRTDLPQVVDDMGLGAMLKKGDALEAIQAGKKTAGETIGTVMKAVDSELDRLGSYPKSERLYIGDILDDIEARYVAPYKVDGVTRSGFNREVREIEKKIAELRKTNIDSLGKLQDERVFIRKSTPKYDAMKSDAQNLVHSAYDDMYSQISDKIKNDIVPDIAGAIKKPELAEQLIKASRNYHVMSSLEPIVQSQAWKEASKKIVSFRDLMNIIAGGEIGKSVGSLVGFGLGKAEQLAPQAKFLMADVVNGVAKKVGEIPSSVKSMLGSSGVKVARGIVPASVSGFTRSQDKDKVSDELTKKLYLDEANPESLINIIADKMSALQEELPEEHRVGLSNQTIKITEYLRSIAPKAPLKNPLDNTKWRPSDAQLSKFNRKAELAINPYQILKYMQSGTVTQDQVDTVAQLYPRLMDKIRTELATQIADSNKNGKTLPNMARINASKVLGFPIDRVMGTAQTLQNNFMKQESLEKTDSTNIPRASKLKTTNLMSEQDALAFRKIKPQT